MENLLTEIPQEVGPALLVVITAILLDVIFGVILHIKKGDFNVRKIPQFLATGVLPYVGGLVALAIAAQYVGLFYTEIFLSIAGLVAIKYVADLKDKAKELFGVGNS